MDEICQKIWELAKPYYLEARPYDIFHIEWMMKQADKIADKPEFNEKIVIPLVILHDIGYYVFDDIFKHPREESKKVHMKEGAKIAEKILKEVNYDSKLSKKIIYFVSVHDNWFFGDHELFKQNKDLYLFNDLDFISGIADMERIKKMSEHNKMEIKDVVEYWKSRDKLKYRPFCCKETEELFKNTVDELEKKINL